MCVANSARSQLAEGLARRILGTDARVESAGSRPASVNPFAIRVLREMDIDISSHVSKGVNDLPKDFLDSLDFVITLCAEEVCPVFLSKAKKIHWPLTDPAGSIGSDDDQLRRFRATRDEIARRLLEFRKSHLA